MTTVESLPWLRLAPPIFAIALAVVLRDVNFALLLATFLGCLLLTDFSVSDGIDKLCDVAVKQIADADHASVILFTVLLGAMISLMNDSGGTAAVVDRLTRFASNRRRGQVLTWLCGMVVFFDDYANTMLIGGSMRPLADRLRISRAKLAFLIDATAAPVAGLLLSTWTAFEIDQVQTGLHAAGISADAGAVFLQTIPYRIYPLLAIVGVGVIACSGRDFGAMLQAEERSVVPENVSSSTFTNGSVWFAMLPIAALVLVVAIAVLQHGLGFDAYRLLLVASLAASTTAAIVPCVAGRLSISECSRSWAEGIASMIPAIIVLTLAWAVSDICREENLNTAGYIISMIGDSVSPSLLPSLAFITAGAIAVSIGSSFTTMALLVPLFIPLSWSILQSAEISDLQASHPVFLATIGAILAGAIFGDHCSPISDTTVLSSAAAGCDHLQHVATQFPYALLMALFSLLLGYLPIGLGVPCWIALPLSCAGCIGAFLIFGREPQFSAAENSTQTD